MQNICITISYLTEGIDSVAHAFLLLFSLPLTNDLRALTACQIRVMRRSKWIFKFVLVHSSENRRSLKFMGHGKG